MKRLSGFLSVCAALAAIWALASCSGAAPEALDPGARGTALAAPELLSLGGAKSTSGLPQGIFVTWTRSTSDRAAGYYLYRDINPIPDPPEGETLDPSLRVNGGDPIEQPLSGESVTHNDIFSVVIGETYYYRVTIVDTDDLESDPSNEMSWTVHGHSVTGLDPTSAFWGDIVTITGDTFGVYDLLIDSVQFNAVGGGFVAGSVETWADTEITVTVPVNAVTGPVGVVVNGTVANTDEDLTILNPIITDVSPNPAFAGETVTVSGVNLSVGAGDEVLSRGVDDISGNVQTWISTQIEFVMPDQPLDGDLAVMVNGRPSNAVALTQRPEVFSVAPLTAEAGESITLFGNGFSDPEATVQGKVLLDGLTELTVTDWSELSVTFDVAGSPGPHVLTILRDPDPGVVSNDFAFTIQDPLTVELGGLSEGEVYRPIAPPTLVVSTAADCETIELLVDGIKIGESSAAPFDGLDLLLATHINGAHSVSLRATRRSVVVESTPANIFIYSLVGDIDSSGTVDMADRDALEPLLGLTVAEDSYRAWFDSDEDGEVTEKDLAAVGYNFGNTVTAAE